MDPLQTVPCTAFEGSRRIASGELAQVALATKSVIDRRPRAQVLIFSDLTGEPIEVDFRGTPEEVLKRLGDSPGEAAPAPPARHGPRSSGRPRLGVVAREVTLLPQHWEWLSSQPGGASVTLRKLVHEARRASEGKDRVRRSQEAAYRVMSALAGDAPGFEEATRALFAGNRERFDALVGAWPGDVRDYARELAAGAFADAADGPPPESVSRGGTA
jgi:hypothetical protein